MKGYPTEDSSRTITTSAVRAFAGTLISRVSGLGREVAMALLFGTNPAVAAFWMAFRFSHLLRRLFGEGALQAVFIPHFEAVRKEDPAKGARFFYDLSMSMTLLLFLITVLVEAVFGCVLYYKELSEANREIIRLTMQLFPALPFIALYPLQTSLLYCHRSYFFPSVAPVALNGIWIATALFLRGKAPEQAMESLARILVLAFACQWAVTLPQTYLYLKKAMGREWWLQKGASVRYLCVLLRPFLFGLVGVAATQVNSALDAIFARMADPEGPATLWYALRIQQLPLALFGVGLMNALLPPMSRAIEQRAEERYRSFLRLALRQTVLIMVPLSACVALLGWSGINLVYGHGAFTTGAVFQTTRVLWAYSAGLFPMTAVLILAAAYYAHKNYRTPALCALGTVAINVFLNGFFLFVCHWGVMSVALATSVAALLNAGLLAFYLGASLFSGLGRVLLQVVGSTLLASIVTLYLGHSVFHDPTWLLFRGMAPMEPITCSLLHRLLIFMAECALFGGTFYGLARLFRIEGLAVWWRRTPFAAEHEQKLGA